MNTEPPSPKRGEVWRVNFDPTMGAEIKKIRPAVVVSSDAIGKLPIKIIAPITTWKDSFANNIWHVMIKPDESNGIVNVSAVDALQIRGVDIERFVGKLGRVSPGVMDEISAAIAIVIEY